MSASKTGKIETTNEDSVTVRLDGELKPTLNSGILSNSAGNGYVVATDDSINDSEATFIMNSGKIVASGLVRAIKVKCTLVQIKGGEISEEIEYNSGTLSFEGHANPSGIAVMNDSGVGVEASDIALPCGFYFEYGEGNEVSTLIEYFAYTIAGSPVIAIDIGERADGSNRRYIVVNGVREAYGTDYIYGVSDEGVIFTCALKNIHVAKYKTNFVCKTYTKLTVNGEQFIVYGEAVTGNVYDTAQGLLSQGILDEDTFPR